MSLTTTVNRNDYTGDGASVTFAYTYLIFANTDLQVYVGGVLKTLTTDYSVTGVGTAGGGNVVFVTAPALNATVELLRVEPFTRTSNYIDNDPFAMATLNNDLDKLTMLVQQLNEQAGRSPSFAKTSLFKNITIPDLTGLAGYVLSVGSDNNSFAWILNTTVANLTYPLTTKGDIFIQSATGGVANAARLAVGVTTNLLGVVSGLPSWRTPAQALGDLSLPTSGYLKGAAGPAFASQATPIPTADGGTGVASPTAHGVLVGEGAAAITPVTLTNGQLLIGSTGADPVAAALGIAGALSATTGAGSLSLSLGNALGGALVGSAAGDYTTSVAATSWADVDATNLKASVTIPTGAKLLIVVIVYSLASNLIVDGLAHVRVLAAGAATAIDAYMNNGSVTATGNYNAFGVITNPTAGAQTISLQFSSDGTHPFTMKNVAAEGANFLLPRLLYAIL